MGRTRMNTAPSVPAGKTLSLLILKSISPDFRDAVVASSFNTALSVRQYLNAPHGSVYGFAPTPARAKDISRQTNATPIAGLYLASSYVGLGGYTRCYRVGGSLRGYGS